MGDVEAMNGRRKRGLVRDPICRSLRTWSADVEDIVPFGNDYLVFGSP